MNSDQVLKSAPSGEYLPTGSFSIRGKKNYLPSSNLILGYSFLFKLEESSVARHADERSVKTLEEELSSASVSENAADDVEIELSEGEDDDDPDEKENNEAENADVGSKLIDEENADDSSDDESTEKEATSDSEEAGTAFPDTEIKIRHTGKEFVQVFIFMSIFNFLIIESP